MAFPSDSSGLANPGLAPVVGDPTAPEKDMIDYGDVTLSAEDAKRLASFLCSEIQRSDADTSDFRQKCIDMMNFVDPQPVTKSFPWPNAANFFIPMPRTVVDAFKSSFKMTVVKQREMFVAEVTDPGFAGIPEGTEGETERAFAEAAEKLGVDPGGIDLKGFFDRWLEEILITGIGPAKLVNETKSQVVMALGPSGALPPVTKELVYHRGPKLYAVPVNTWCWPAGLWGNIQAMPWVGNWVELTPDALRSRVGPPFGYVADNVEKAIAGRAASPLQDATNQTRLQQIAQNPTNGVIRVHEMYLNWDMKNDKTLHSVVVAINVASQQILRIKYTDGFKPFYVEGASPRTGTIFARGIVEPIMQPCKAINMAVNQTFDAQTLANTPCLLYPEDSMAATIVATHGGFFPGIPLAYKEQKQELGVLEFPAPSQTSFTMISFFQQIVERLTRIGPTRLGEVSEGRRTPATLGLSTQQLGAELLDEMIDRIRDTTGRIMSRALVLVWQDDPDYFDTIIGTKRGQLVSSVIKKSVEHQRSLDDVIRIRLSASSSVRSVELDRQNALATTQMTMGWYAQVIQLVQMFAQVQDPTVRNILLSILSASETQMKRLVELANQPDAGDIIPQVAEMLAGLPMPPALPVAPGPGGQGAPGGGAPAGGAGGGDVAAMMQAILGPAANPVGGGGR